MKEQLMQMLHRLKKPSVLLSIVSQVVAVLLMLGFDVNEGMVMSVAVGISSVLVTLGILSNPDAHKSGYGDDILTCSASGNLEPHVMVNGQMVCANCGAVYNPDLEKKK